MSDYLIMLRFDILKLKNYFLEVRRTPKKLVSYVLFLGWLFLFIGPGLMNRANRSFNLTSQTIEGILGIYTLIIIVVICVSALSAQKKLFYKFSMGDVNLLFPSPLEPNRILFWSMLKKIPQTFFQCVLPVIILTPTLLNMGLTRTDFFYVYFSIVMFALSISPLSFLVFLLSVRYQKVILVRSLIIGAIIWLSGNWLWQVGKDFTPLSLLSGFLAPGVWHFPVIGWVVQLTYAAFFGANPATYIALGLLLLTIVIINLLVYRSASDYYEDVIDYAAKVENIREKKRSGSFNKFELVSPSRVTRVNKKKVVIRGNYPASRAFLFKQLVHYRRSSLNEYVGYLTPIAVIAGVAAGWVFANKTGMDILEGFLIINGVIVYLLMFRGIQSPVGLELSFPYIYTLPGTFLGKIAAINLLPTLRFAVNILLVNLSYAFMFGGATAPWTAVFISLIVVCIYIEQSNIMVLSYLLLPSSLDRKLFYPLAVFIQLLSVLIPSALGGGLLFLFSHSVLLAGLGIMLANIGVGVLFLVLSEKIVCHIEMREFSND
jgi:hypothetical protein